MLLMFVLLGFFMMFMAYNAVAHAMLQTADSLAMDAWQVSKLQTSGSFPNSVGDIISNLVAQGIGNSEKKPHYVSEKKWYESGALLSDELTQRFLGYFAGGTDTADATKYIKALNIEYGGTPGGTFDFSGSSVVNGDLVIVVKYKLNYMFKFWGLENGADITQKAVSHLWMKDSAGTNSGYPSPRPHAGGGGGSW
jgi:hypothetical protein